DCALAMAESGAAELVIHARTKADGYKPPAYWDRIAKVRAALRVPVVANGEIWTLADAQRCRTESGCTDLMLGRGMVADPGLALAIAGAGADGALLSWAELLPLMEGFWAQVRVNVAARHQAGRLKQWLHYLRRRYPQAEEAYQRVRTINAPEALQLALFGPAIDIGFREAA
ncbi:MAG TPA: tRNA-dihydrouridine synthase, partial [Roseateles sp.]|nr:tRNA-dihydrouridine synthase [Roseateles sp.]